MKTFSVVTSISMVGSFVAAALSIIGISTTRFYPAIIGFLLRCKNRFMKNKIIYSFTVADWSSFPIVI